MTEEQRKDAMIEKAEDLAMDLENVRDDADPEDN